MADDGRRTFTVRDVMHSRVVSTSPDTPVAEAAAAMVREKVGSALIMQGPFLAGILTERDVLKAAASGADLTTIPVSSWMTKDPQSAAPETPAEQAAQIMLLNGFRHLPIMEGRRVRGVVSLRDLFAARISRPPQQRGAAVLAALFSSTVLAALFWSPPPLGEPAVAGSPSGGPGRRAGLAGRGDAGKGLAGDEHHGRFAEKRS